MLAKRGSGRFWDGVLGESMNPLGHVMRSPGAILLISCYELGHQPLGLASPMGFLNRAGFAPVGTDIARGSFDEESVTRARFVGISAPMHTALRLGVQLAKRVRSINPRCHICFYGLYAPLNAEYLLSACANSIVGGEYEASLVRLVEALEGGQPPKPSATTYGTLVLLSGANRGPVWTFAIVRLR